MAVFARSGCKPANPVRTEVRTVHIPHHPVHTGADAAFSPLAPSPGANRKPCKPCFLVGRWRNAALAPPVLEYRQEGPLSPGACMRARATTIGADHHHRHNHHRRQRDSGDGCDGHHLLFTPPETQICLARDRHRARASDGCDRLTGFLLTLRAHVRRVNLRARHIRHSRLNIPCAGWQ